MHRRRRSTVPYVFAAIPLAFAVGCGGSSERQILDDFFRTSRLRDNVTLANFATTEFDPRTDGIVTSFDIVSVSDEQAVPMPLKQYARALEDARVADQAFNKEKKAYQDANIVAIDRITRAEAAGREVASRDRSAKDAWDQWRADAGQHLKAISTAQRQLAGSRGLAELSLARVRPSVEDVTEYDGELVTKHVMLNATVRTPEGRTEQRALEATLMRAVLKPDAGEDITGRWLVTSIRESAGSQPPS